MSLTTGRIDRWSIMIHLSKNANFHSKSKHIDVGCHWLRDMLESKSLDLAKTYTHHNVLDMMTKGVTKFKHLFCKGGAGVVRASHAN